MSAIRPLNEGTGAWADVWLRNLLPDLRCIRTVDFDIARAESQAKLLKMSYNSDNHDEYVCGGLIMNTKARRRRKKMMREGRPDPTLLRNEWNRKPQTQVVPNRKAEQRRSCCRNRGEDGAVSFAA